MRISEKAHNTHQLGLREQPPMVDFTAQMVSRGCLAQTFRNSRQFEVLHLTVSAADKSNDYFLGRKSKEMSEQTSNISKLDNASVVVGILAWLILLLGLLYARLFLHEKVSSPLAIMSPETFGGIIAVYSGWIVSGIGAVLSLFVFAQRRSRVSFFGILLNALYFVPLGLLFIYRQ